MKIIKDVLKKFLPTPFLRDAFLVYNKIKILTVDRLFFPEYKIDKKHFLIYRHGFPFRESEVSLDDLPQTAAKTLMKDWYKWTQEEFLLILNNKCWIEPDHGWAIIEPNKLVYYSLGVSRTWFLQKPNLFKFWRRKNVINVTQAISLRDSGEENYFHFYNDVLSKLFFITHHNIDLKPIQVIISKKLWDKEYFQYYFKNSSFLQSLKWIVQGNQYIQCESVIFCKPLTHRKDLWSEILSPFRMLTPSNSRLRIFLTRSKSRLRFLENIDEINAICIKHGFSILDTDMMSPKQQVEIFSGAAFIVGIHGAGLTNMAFSNGPCQILELFPPPLLGYLPYHYIMLAKMLKFRYNALIGERGKIKYSGGFCISPKAFENALVNFSSVGIQ